MSGTSISHTQEAFASALAHVEEALPIRMLERRIEKLDISADAKALTMDLARLTMKVGNQIVAIGRKIISVVFDLARKFPMTSFGTCVGLAVSLLIGSIPVLGPLLAPIFGPILIAFGLTLGALQDAANHAARQSLNDLAEKVAILAQRMPTA